MAVMQEVYYFVADLKAGEFASQISIQGGAQYKTLDFALLDGNGRRIDAYYTTAGANGNNEATRVFPIDASGKYIVKLITKGPETTSFRVALGGSALPDRQAPAEPAGGSRVTNRSSCRVVLTSIENMTAFGCTAVFHL